MTLAQIFVEWFKANSPGDTVHMTFIERDKVRERYEYQHNAFMQQYGGVDVQAG